jgi:hypothetical protein
MGWVGSAVRFSMFVGLIWCQVEIFRAPARERMTPKYQRLAFYSTSLFVMIACASLDSFITDFSGGKPWARPIKAGFFLPCICLTLFFAAPYPDDYFGAIAKKPAPTPSTVFWPLVFELIADGVLAEAARWLTTCLVSDTEKSDSLFASASWYVVPLTIYLRQPNLQSRLQFMAAVLG